MNLVLIGNRLLNWNMINNLNFGCFTGIYNIFSTIHIEELKLGNNFKIGIINNFSKCFINNINFLENFDPINQENNIQRYCTYNINNSFVTVNSISGNADFDNYFYFEISEKTAVNTNLTTPVKLVSNLTGIRKCL